MPKSRNRKGQKKRSQARTTQLKNQREKIRAEMMEKFKKIQEDGMMKNAGDNTEVKEGENIVNTDDFGLEEMEIEEEKVSNN